MHSRQRIEGNNKADTIAGATQNSDEFKREIGNEMVFHKLRSLLKKDGIMNHL